MQIKLYTDGGSRGNPGIAGSGWVAYEGLPAKETGSRNGRIGSLRDSAVASEGAEKILGKCGNYLGHMTNNQAEYEGLLRGITWITKHYPDAQLAIYMDSLLIVNQIKGTYRVKSQHLLTYYLKIHKLLKSLPGYSITHVRRNFNSVADELANLAMDARADV